MTTLPADILETVEPNRQRLLVTLAGQPDPVVCRYYSRTTKTMTRDEKEISQRFAALRPIAPAELGGDEINLTWTVEKTPATIVGCL